MTCLTDQKTQDTHMLVIQSEGKIQREINDFNYRRAEKIL